MTFGRSKNLPALAGSGLMSSLLDPKSTLKSLGHGADFRFEPQLIHNITDEGRKVISNPASKEEGRKYEDHRVILPALRGYLRGAQFYAVAGKVYGLAKQKALGREIPTGWFLQDQGLKWQLAMVKERVEKFCRVKFLQARRS